MQPEYSRKIFDNTQISNFMKMCPLGAELFHADGQTDEQADRHDKANSRVSQFCELTYKSLPALPRVT